MKCVYIVQSPFRISVSRPYMEIILHLQCQMYRENQGKPSNIYNHINQKYEILSTCFGHRTAVHKNCGLVNRTVNEFHVCAVL